MKRAVLRVLQRGGFTLVELLIVVAILALLISILLPALGHARRSARIVKAHAELRSIEIALMLYAEHNNNELPPTRFSCSLRIADELPGELARDRYLPGQRKLMADTYTGDDFLLDTVQMQDVFKPEETYKYRAVGPALLNETQLLLPPDGARLWVPEHFPPHCDSDEGRYWRDPKTTPVRFAVWSVGPDPQSPKFEHLPGRMPIPSRYWCKGAADTGVITHFQSPAGKQYQSP